MEWWYQDRSIHKVVLRAAMQSIISQQRSTSRYNGSGGDFIKNLSSRRINLSPRIDRFSLYAMTEMSGPIASRYWTINQICLPVRLIKLWISGHYVIDQVLVTSFHLLKDTIENSLHSGQSTLKFVLEISCNHKLDRNVDISSNFSCQWNICPKLTLVFDKGKWFGGEFQHLSEVRYQLR